MMAPGNNHGFHQGFTPGFHMGSRR
jgi:hypothetical protein